MYGNETIADFLDTVASAEPVPGGGSCAAMIGATGTALLEMVANLTMGKKQYAEVAADIEPLLAQARALRESFLDLADEDAAAFDGVMAAFRLPKRTDKERATRRDAIQDATVLAAEVPQRTAKQAVEGLRIAKTLAEIGNPNAITDVGVGALSLFTALRGAAYNVTINIGSIKNEETVARLERGVDSALETGEIVIGEVKATVTRRMG